MPGSYHDVSVCAMGEVGNYTRWFFRGENFLGVEQMENFGFWGCWIARFTYAPRPLALRDPCIPPSNPLILGTKKAPAP